MVFWHNGRAGAKSINRKNPMELTPEERDLVQRLEREVEQETQGYDARENKGRLSDFWKLRFTFFV